MNHWSFKWIMQTFNKSSFAATTVWKINSKVTQTFWLPVCLRTHKTAKSLKHSDCRSVWGHTKQQSHSNFLTVGLSEDTQNSKVAQTFWLSVCRRTHTTSMSLKHSPKEIKPRGWLLTLNRKKQTTTRRRRRRRRRKQQQKTTTQKHISCFLMICWLYVIWMCVYPYKCKFQPRTMSQVTICTPFPLPRTHTHTHTKSSSLSSCWHADVIMMRAKMWWW